MTPDKIEKDRVAESLRTMAIKSGEQLYSAEIHLLRRAADRLDALTAENAALKARVVELEDALEPFARRADTYDPPEDDDWVVDWYDSVDRPTLGNFRLARAALEKSHE